MFFEASSQILSESNIVSTISHTAQDVDVEHGVKVVVGRLPDIPRYNYTIIYKINQVWYSKELKI